MLHHLLGSAYLDFEKQDEVFFKLFWVNIIFYNEPVAFFAKRETVIVMFCFTF